MTHDPTYRDPLSPAAVADYEAGAGLLRALSAPVRLALVHLLAADARCVHELVDALGLPQPLVSQHLRTLRSAGLVVAARDGREMRYRRADEHVAHIARDALLHAEEPSGSA
jgi:DNA-binding transcriptional ArsR family regulator